MLDQMNRKQLEEYIKRDELIVEFSVGTSDEELRDKIFKTLEALPDDQCIIPHDIIVTGTDEILDQDDEEDCRYG